MRFSLLPAVSLGLGLGLGLASATASPTSASASTSSSASGSAPIPLEELSDHHLQQWLRHWSLDRAFGPLFDDLQVDGLALSLLFTGDGDNDSGYCESGEWLAPVAGGGQKDRPRPPPLLWRKLCLLLSRVHGQGGVREEDLIQGIVDA